MVDRDVVMEALSTLLDSNVISHKTGNQRASSCQSSGQSSGSTLNVRQFVTTVLDTDDCSDDARAHFNQICCLILGDDGQTAHVRTDIPTPSQTHFRGAGMKKEFLVDEDEFFDPPFDYDFTHLKDTQTYYRGDEVYERPCGWTRVALKILNKYPDGNTWLGTTGRGTQSVGGEWPVSYHGTSKKGAEGVIGGHYEPGSGQVYGRGIYSTPYISEAVQYVKTFVSKKTGKTYQVLLQNRINPKYREKHYGDKYWLVRIPPRTPDAQEVELVERAIRPYGLLLKAL